MFTLPPPRDEWDCKDCGDRIYRSRTLKYSSGKYKILNANNSPRGKRDEEHHHIEPVNMREYNYHQEHFPCVLCGYTYNKEKCPICPTCFKLQCRKCPHLQTWILLLGRDNQICDVCGAQGMDVYQVFHSYDRLYGKTPMPFIDEK